MEDDNKKRPSNEDLYKREPQLEEGSDAVVATAKTFYPEDAKVIEAQVRKDDAGTITGYQVTLGWQEGDRYRVHEVTFDPSGGVRDREERDSPFGEGDKPKSHVPAEHDQEKPLSERKSDVKLKPAEEDKEPKPSTRSATSEKPQ